MKKIFVLKIGINDSKKEEALEFIIKGLAQKGKKYKIFTPNPEMIVYANKDRRFKNVLNSADLALPDGMGLLWAAKILGIQLQNRITGVDFMEELCKEAAKWGLTVGLMGGGPKIAEKVAECLRRKYPSLKITFVGEEWPSTLSSRPTERSKGVEAFGSEAQARRGSHLPKANAIDILFVALGFPKQEKWVDENLAKIPVRAAMVVGGSFDYISGVVPRAPLFLRALGLEWLFRLIVQPWRIRRQLALIEFVFLVLKERIFGKTS